MRGHLEALSLWGMALGVAAMLQPWWAGGMRTGFLVAAASTVAHIVLSHLPKREPGDAS